MRELLVMVIEVWLMDIKTYISACSPLLNETSSGGRLNKKDGLTKYGDSHVKDKTS